MLDSEIAISAPFGLAVRDFRKRSGWSQSQLASRVHLSQSFISKIEQNSVARISRQTLAILADVVGTSPQKLLNGDLLEFVPVVPDKQTKYFIRSVYADLLAHRCLVLIGPRFAVHGSEAKAVLCKAIEEELGTQKLYKPIVSLCRKGQSAEAFKMYLDSDISSSDKTSLLQKCILRSKKPSAIHYELAKLPVRGALTFNIDHLFEDAYAAIQRTSLFPIFGHDFCQDNQLCHEEMFYAKLRGDAANWRSIMLDGCSPELVLSLSHIACISSDVSIIAVGFDHDDPLLSLLLERVHCLHFYVVINETPPDDLVDASRNQHIAVIGDEMLPAFLSNLNPKSKTSSAVYDSPWGKMPSQKIQLVFSDAESRLRDFIFAETHRLAIVKGSSGSGLSSFIASRLQEYSEISNTLIYRLEAKKWLPLDAYVLYILSHLPSEAYEDYQERRRNEAEGWSDTKEAYALADAISSLGSRVIIFIDLADRLKPADLSFWKSFVEHVSNDISIIMSSTEQIDLSIQADLINLGQPSTESLQKVLGLYCTKKTAEEISDAMPKCDLNRLILSASLVKHNLSSIGEVPKLSIQEMCNQIVEYLNESFSGIDVNQVLKACVVFHAPRPLDWIMTCTDIKNTESTKTLLDGACDLGLMSVRESFTDKEHDRLYYMPGTIRDVLSGILFLKEGKDLAKMARLAAKIFKANSIDKLRPLEATRQEVVAAIPMICLALFHYIEAGDRKEYIKLVVRSGEYIQRIYHFNIIDKWLDVSLISGRQLKSPPEIEFSMAILKAKVKKTEANPKEYRQCLKDAKSVVEKITTEETKRKNQIKLMYEEGICASMTRDYPHALEIFQELFELTRESKPDKCLDSLARIIQVSISIGELAVAEKHLGELRENLEESLPSEYEKYDHHWCMYYRHKSTLNTMRLHMYAFRSSNAGISRDTLLENAILNSEICRNKSYTLGYYSAGRASLPDETGVGIGYLKEAQALYAGHKFAEALAAAEKGERILTNFANNRWWRMSCHDIAARSASYIYDINSIGKAGKHLDHAKQIFRAAGGNDMLRRCELRHTEGIILQQMGKTKQAVEHFSQSLLFSKTITSPCVYYMHLRQLIKALVDMDETEEAAKQIQIMKDLRKAINW